MSVRVHTHRARSHSSSPLLASVLFGPPRTAVWLAPGQLLVGDYVVSLTAPGTPRMPNGIECGVAAGRRSRLLVGGGIVVIGRRALDPGQEWNPTPRVSVHARPTGPLPVVGSIAEWNLHSSSAGDELVAGYVAGLVLLHGAGARAVQLTKTAISHATPLGATLLRHAARGEVPEPVHALLESGDARPLLAWDGTGAWWLRGMLSAGFPLEDTLGQVVAGAT